MTAISLVRKLHLGTHLSAKLRSSPSDKSHSALAFSKNL